MTKAVLDASALLAMLQVEPGGDEVADIIDKCVISAVNLTEVVTALCNKGMALSKATAAVGIFQMEVVPFDKAQALRAAALREPTRKAGLSLGDRACLALAQTRTLTAVTADRAWAKVSVGIEVRLVR